ncbi:MAG: peptidoglycan DD-metalloendopeptidase family protein [Bacteroidota bacterium]
MSKRNLSIILMLSLAIIAYLLLPLLDHKTPDVVTSELVAKIDSTIAPVKEPNILYGMNVDSMLVIEDKVKRNQNISDILIAHNVSHQDIFQLAKISKSVFDVRKIGANKKYTLIFEPDSVPKVNAFVYEHSPVDYVVFNLSDSLTVEKKQKEVDVVEKEVSGVIEANLAITMDELGLSPQLTNDFVDVFAWQIDFFRLQKGDRFKLIYEDRLVEGQSIGTGTIKAILFEHIGNDFYAFHFDQGDGLDYFDEKGNSLRKALLKYPLDFTRISSRYSGRRFHPVQKRWKAHRGTDFAAKKGTPIRAVGDAIVTEARYGKYNGNYVKLRHNATYTTQYLHMSKIKRGIKPGIKVRQGDIIGYVGSTGLARGNHLCYRFWKNGVQIDALKVKLPPSAPIAEENRSEFYATRDDMMERLKGIHFAADEELIFASIK